MCVLLYVFKRRKKREAVCPTSNLSCVVLLCDVGVIVCVFVLLCDCLCVGCVCSCVSFRVKNKRE